MNDVKDQLQRSVAPEVNEAVHYTSSEVKKGLFRTLIDKNDEWQTSFPEVKAEIAKSRKDVTSLTQKHDVKSKKEKLSAETELVQDQLKIDGIPEAAKDKPDTPAIKRETDYVEAILEFLEEYPKIENILRHGKHDPSRTRPRTMLVTIKSIWDVQTIPTKSKFYGILKL